MGKIDQRAGEFWREKYEDCGTNKVKMFSKQSGVMEQRRNASKESQKLSPVKRGHHSDE